LVALFHLLRIFEDWPVMIADWSVPKSVSWIARHRPAGWLRVAKRGSV
jgi:hypothetical protein